MRLCTELRGGVSQRHSADALHRRSWARGHEAGHWRPVPTLARTAVHLLTCTSLGSSFQKVGLKFSSRVLQCRSLQLDNFWRSGRVQEFRPYQTAACAVSVLGFHPGLFAALSHRVIALPEPATQPSARAPSPRGVGVAVADPWLARLSAPSKRGN